MTGKRPILRYYGGKWRISSWIIEHFPPHRIYVEPFAGAASVLLRKEPSQIEVLNDLNRRVTSLFAVLRQPSTAKRLYEMLWATPYSAAEFADAQEQSPDPVEDARRLIILGHQAHGATGPSGGKRTGWRRRCENNRTANAATAWASIYQFVPWWCDRLRSVYIECDDALAVIRRWDAPDALIYADPPYLKEMRGETYKNRAYAHDMDRDGHVKLAGVLHDVVGG